ncbi:MAG: phytanoyl-CoA dioxygenase family protein [Bacteroidota bacterium]
MILTEQQKKEFNENGLLVIPNFYDVKADVEPIQYGIWKIIGLLIKKYSIAVVQMPFASDTFDFGYQQLIAADRRFGGEVYDAVKQIPAFMRLVTHSKNEDLMHELRKDSLPGLAAGGYGIRIDNPNEEKFRSLWHYEYRDQLRSVDGVVFWSPLVAITQELGPVQICPGSHKDGLRRSYINDPEMSGKPGAYGLKIENEEEIISNYGVVSPLSNPGDLVLMDFLTIHSSGKNIGDRSRWSMQFRYFNFSHPSGIKIDWKGCVANGVQLKDVHPELIIE